MSENKGKTGDPSRKLTDAEKKRLEAFKITEDKLKLKGYARKDLTISIAKANIVGPLLVLPFIIVFCVLFFLIHGLEPLKAMQASKSIWTPISLILAVLSMIPLAVVHEFIHGITWSIKAENHMKDIEYGFIKELITPYCYCRSPLSKGMYILGSLMPMTILGAVVCVFGIIFASPILMLIGGFQLLGGAGDILITSMLICYKTKGKDTVLLDHPTDCGLVVFEKDK